MSDAKPALSVIGRDVELATALGYLAQGASVDVVGPRGSGRSAFLAALHMRLAAEDIGVVAVHGIAALRPHPLAALHLSGALRAPDGRAAGVHAAFDALVRSLRGPRSVILLDDGDELDETSWGVIEMARRAVDVPIVHSRLFGRDARPAPYGPPLSTAYVVEMSALSYEAVEAVVRDRLDGDIEPRTLSRIFAKSGGVVGLVLHIVEAALREGVLQRRDGLWEAAGDLWSLSLRGVVEAHLDGLDDGTRDVLELVSLLGLADVDTVLRLTSWDAIERLERRGLLRVVPSGARRILTVTPPLLAEYFRHEPLAARRIRLTRLIAERLGDGEPVPAVLGDVPPAAPHDQALLMRLIQERVRTHRLATQAAWETQPTAAAGADYLEALLRDDTPVDVLREVLRETDPAAGSALARARFLVARAHITAYVDRDVEAALAALREAVADLGEYGGLASAAEVALLAHTRAIPVDVVERLPVHAGQPPEVRMAVWEAVLLAHVCLGRFGDARRVYGDIEAAPDVQPSAIARALFGFVLIGEGDIDGALAWSLRGVEAARELLDIDAARAHGAVAAMALVFAGDYQPIETLLETLLAAGNPLPFPSGVSLIFANVASVIASRRGDTPTAERFAAQAHAMREVPGPLPGQAASWAEAQLHAADGGFDDAADLIWHEAERLWERGARFSAALGYLAVAEIQADDDRFARAIERSRAVGGGLLSAQIDYLVARRADDADGLVASFESLRLSGRSGMALNALRRAAEVHHAQGRMREADATVDRAEAYAASLAPRWLDTTRFVSTSPLLTEREMQVARLVAAGCSNREIADRLVLSVRTVESHMNRIMRKLGVVSRQAVAWYMDSRVAS